VEELDLYRNLVLKTKLHDFVILLVCNNNQNASEATWLVMFAT
jgi:hypothetical protein